jgi:hypothetical protein
VTYLVENRLATSRSDWKRLASQIGSIGMRLYASHGVPQLFSRVGAESGVQFEDSWLYLPASMLDTIQLSAAHLKPVGSSLVSMGNPFLAEQHSFIPLIVDGKIAAVLVSDISHADHLPSLDIQELSEGIAYDRAQRGAVAVAVGDEFISRLFHRDNSLDNFIRRMLTWISQIWPSSYAGMYVESQGVFVQRLTAGSLDHCHCLPREIGLEVAQACQTSGDISAYLVPAEYLPEQPAFLTTPPDFLCMSPGVAVDSGRQLLVFAGPGGVSRQAIERLSEITRLVARLHVSQFTTCAELTRYYGQLGAATISDDQLSDTLKDLFTTIAQQVTLTRVVVDLGESSTIRRCREIVIRPGHSTMVQPLDRVDVPAIARDTLAAGRPHLVGQINLADLDTQSAKERYLQNVRAELYLPMADHGSGHGLVVFGSSVAGEYLSTMQPLLRCISEYIWLHARLASGVARGEIPATVRGAEGASAAADRRQIVMRRLGLTSLHGLNGALSVAGGQIELMRETSDQPTGHLSERRLSGLEEAVATIWKRVDAISRVISLPDAGDLIHDADRFVQGLPTLVDGLLTQLRDTKNISITLQILPVHMSQPVLDADLVYDFLLPVLASVLDAAVCSGTIELSVSVTPRQSCAVVSFRRTLTGYTGLEAIAMAALPGYPSIPDASAARVIAVGNVRCRFVQIDDDRCQCRIECANRDPRVSPTTAVAQESE